MRTRDTLETAIQLDIQAHTSQHGQAAGKESVVVAVETAGFNDTVSLRTLFP